MSIVFECLGCRAASVVDTEPPRCPHCGKGNGLVRSLPADPPALGEYPEHRSQSQK
jgi:hypothetical protein